MLLQWLVDADALLGALDLELDSSTAAGDAAVRALIEVAAGEPDERSRRGWLAGPLDRSGGPQRSRAERPDRDDALARDVAAGDPPSPTASRRCGVAALATVERSGRHRLQTPLSPRGAPSRSRRGDGPATRGRQNARRTRRERAPPDVGAARASATPRAPPTPRPGGPGHAADPHTAPTPAGRASSGARQSRRPRRPDRPLTRRN